MTRIESTPAREGTGPVRSVATLALLAFAMLIVSLDQYIVVVALPEIGHALDYSSQTLQAVVSTYSVVTAGFLLLGAVVPPMCSDADGSSSRGSRSTPADRSPAAWRRRRRLCS
jgi:MFS family permease